MVPVRYASDLDKGRLDQERQRSMGEWKIAIRDLAKRHAISVLEHIRDIKEHSQS